MQARWELHKDAAYCFEKILEAAAYKTPFSHPNKTSKTYCPPLKKQDKIVSDVLPMDSYT